MRFRYYVTDGGPNGNNSDIIGLDTFSVDRPGLAIAESSKTFFSVYPNPANDIVNIAAANGSQINSAKITDINGRVVIIVKVADICRAQLNVSELNSGVYFLNVETTAGSSTARIVKN